MSEEWRVKSEEWNWDFGIRNRGGRRISNKEQGMLNHEVEGRMRNGRRKGGTIIHQALVILSEAKELFQLLGITNKTVNHPKRTVILNALSSCPPLADQDHLGTSHHDTITTYKTRWRRRNAQCTIFNVQWVSNWQSDAVYMIFIKRKTCPELDSEPAKEAPKLPKEKISFAFLFASFAPLAVNYASAS